MAAAASANFCDLLETEVTFRFIKSSRLIAVTSGKLSGTWADAARTRKTTRMPSKKIHRAEVIGTMLWLQIGSAATLPSERRAAKLARDFRAFPYTWKQPLSCFD